MGYGFGCINTAALFSKLKHKDMRESGTGNLGATNAVIVLGRAYGVLILLLDILKAYIAYKVASLIFAHNIYSGLLAGLGTMLGHNFPFYMKFKGGKGLATFAGTVLAHNPLMFLILLLLVIVLLLIVNYSFIVPFAGSTLFAVMTTWQTKNLFVGIITSIMAILIMAKHIPNLKKAISGKDVRVRDYIKKYIFHNN